MNLLTKICQSICSLGWNEIGTIATVAAVIVALVANHKSSEAIKMSLKIHEQSKNVDLFEKRIGIINEIKSQDKTSEISLSILFNMEIFTLYQSFKKSVEQKTEYEERLKYYRSVLSHPDGEGGYISMFDELENLEVTLNDHNYPENEIEEYKRKCKEYEVTDDNSGQIYNYDELTSTLVEIKKEINLKKEVLLIKMQEFISKSISPIDEKGK